MKLTSLALSAVVLATLSTACSAAAPENDAVDQEEHLRNDAGPDARPDALADGGVDPDGALAAGSGTFVDPRDGQRYPTIKLGAKTWLARNLNFAIAGSSFCYGDAASNCAADGRLYPFSVARTACPPSFHLGTDEDWKALEVATGMDADQLDLEGYSTVRGTDEGATLKTADGFGARMAGFRSGTSYEARGDRTYFWTATTRGADVWRRRIADAEPTVFRFTNPPEGFAISVRCVMD
jgi:uncharacterized protein (TIGR02145 family)